MQGRGAEIHEVMLDPNFATGVDLSTDSNDKKLIYIFPFDEVPKFADFLDNVANKLPWIKIDVEMTSLEDAYVNMAKQEEILH
jgi:hypothetical protein